MALQRTWTWELGAPRERLWTYLGDTDWVNEAAGLPKIAARYEPLPQGGSKRIVSFRRGPLVVEWEERPTLWQAPEFHEVERVYSRGPLRRFRTRTTLDSLGAGRTGVRVDVELAAAARPFEPLLPLIAAFGRRGAGKAFARAEILARRAQPNLPGDAGDALASFLQSAEDRELRRMRPYELADSWQLPRREVLRAFLNATRAGRLNLRWSVLCPGCRGADAGVETLAQLEREHHCPACNIAFDASFDRSVEVTFDARPLRPRLKEAALYCIASPARSPHVHAQHTLAPGAREEAVLALLPGTYDVNAGPRPPVPFVVSHDERAAELPVRISADAVEAPAAVCSGAVRIAFENRSERDALVRIEDGRWPDTIVTAAQVTALQEFRDLFSSEVLSLGLELGIETIAVLFTDLVGSTALYSRTGDAPAFRIVSDHFAAIREVVARYEGAVVKTIGDAVMAVFADPANALRAAVELDRCVQGVECDGSPLRLRVGMHAGPCIAMRANGRIDYFGTTVNLAARLEAMANAGEVTMARNDAERAGIAALLEPYAGRCSNEALAIKGFERPVEVVRLRVL